MGNSVLLVLVVNHETDLVGRPCFFLFTVPSKNVSNFHVLRLHGNWGSWRKAFSETLKPCVVHCIYWPVLWRIHAEMAFCILWCIVHDYAWHWAFLWWKKIKSSYIHYHEIIFCSYVLMYVLTCIVCAKNSKYSFIRCLWILIRNLLFLWILLRLSVDIPAGISSL